MVRLVENEVAKIICKRRIHVIVAILLVIICLFAYGEHYTISRMQERVAVEMGIENSTEWENLIRQQLTDLERRMDNPYIPEEGRASLRVRIDQLSFYLDKGINPISPTSAKFMGDFMEQSILLLLPLMIIILAADIVSGEFNNGTIKLLLTRPVQRWKILLSKLWALIMMEMVVIISIAFISCLVSLVVFREGGFDEPVITGFKILEGSLDASQIRTIPRWQYLVMVYSIGYYVAFVIGCLSLMVSVMVKSTSASIGIMMSALIGGSFLSLFIADWKITRYLFTVNMNLVSFLSGEFIIFEGLSMTFSTLVLLAWATGALFLAFLKFTREDILS